MKDLTPEEFLEFSQKHRPMAIIPEKEPEYGFDILFADGTVIKVWCRNGKINFTKES